MKISILSFISSTFKKMTPFLSILVSTVLTLFLAATLLLFDLFLSEQALCSSNKPNNSNFYNMKEETSWHISALKVSYDNDRQIYIAEGQVVILGIKKELQSETETTKESNFFQKNRDSGEAIRLEADYVEFSNITRDAEAIGRVLLVAGKDYITSEHLKFNVETEVGTIYNGVVFIDENHFYIKGDTIEKTGKGTYRSDRASITSCDGDNPDWRLSGKDIKVTIDGYGTAKSATFWTGKIPALYSPIILFPAKTKRQTGLLIPRISSSDKKGFEVDQPLFVAISQGTDATFYADYMSKRGLKTGIEYRYVLSDSSFGTMFYDYLNDGYDKYLDENQIDSSRYWFRMKNNHTFDNRWSAKLDIDYVSDSEYLREFKDGFTGFDSVDRYFSNTFGRSIDEYDDTTRQNSLNINRTWSSASLNIGAQWFDNIEAREADNKEKFDINNTINGEDTTLQKLPSVQFDTVRQQLGKSTLYYDIDSEYRYFYRQNRYNYNTLSYLYSNKNIGVNLNPLFARYQSLITGHRADIYPRVYMPIKLGAFYIEPSAGVRQSLWYLDDYSGENNNFKSSNSSIVGDRLAIDSEFDQTEYKKFSHREMADLNVELSTKLSKIFDIGEKYSDKKGVERKNSAEKSLSVNSNSSEYKANNGKFAGTNTKYTEKIRHEIIPKLQYLYIPDVSQNELPYFDELDYIGKKNRVTLSIGNRLTHRNENRFYNEFAWFELSQSYRIDETELEKISSQPQLDSLELGQNTYLDKIFHSTTTIFNLDEPYFKSGKSFSDILARVEFSPTQFLSFNSNSNWSPYNNSFSSNDSGIKIKDKRGDALQAWYRYDESDYESIFGSLDTKITDNLSLFFICEHSLIDNKNIESHTGFYLNKSCWSMRLSYSDTPEEKRLSLMVNLHGIGEFGNR